MPFNWRWLFLIALLSLKVPEFVVNPDLSHDEDYDVLPFPRTDSLPFSQWDGQVLRDNSISQEMESDGEGTRKTTALLPIGTSEMHLDVNLLPDGCHVSESSSPGNPTLDKINKVKDSVSSPGYMNGTSILLQAKRHIGAYFEMIRSMLPQKWQPGSVFREGAKVVMSMTPALDVLTILFLIWRGLKSRTNQLTNKQLLQQFNRRMEESLVKISALNKKIRATKGQMRRSQRLLYSSRRCNKKLKASARKLGKRLEKMAKERDSLCLLLKESNDRLKNASLEQESFKNTFQEKETALQQNLVQLEQVWRAKLEKAMEERSENDQHVKEEMQALWCKLLRTEKQYQIQMHDYEVKYRDSLKLVSHLQQQIEEHTAADLESRQEKTANAAAEVREARRRMAMSRDKYQKRDMKTAS